MNVAMTMAELEARHPGSTAELDVFLARHPGLDASGHLLRWSYVFDAVLEGPECRLEHTGECRCLGWDAGWDAGRWFELYSRPT